MKTYIAVLTETAYDGQAYVQIHSSSSPEQLCRDIRDALKVETNERDIHFDYDEPDLLDAVTHGNVASGPMDIEVTDHDSEFTLSTVVVTVPDAEVFKCIRKDAAGRIKALMGRLGTDSLCSTDVSETEACWVADNYSDSRDTYTVDAINCERGVPNPNSDYVRIIREPRTFFPITSVSRDDLEAKGFDASGVDEATMETLARKMSDAYVGETFWTDLDIIAESLGIPKKS